MSLEAFLERFVEGYLFGDLRAMATLRPPEGKQYGGAHYPIVMTALAGIELLGVLTHEAKFSAWNGDQRFKYFWKTYVYPDDPAKAEMASLVYDLVRQGFAHTYLTKPIVEVTKGDMARHLTRTAEGAIVVDAQALASDLEAAYFRQLKPNMNGALLDRMRQRFDELRGKYQEEHTKKLQSVGLVPLGPGTYKTWPNSPSPFQGYSTGVTKAWSPPEGD